MRQPAILCPFPFSNGTIFFSINCITGNSLYFGFFKDIAMALEMLGQSCVDGIYIVDSFGSLFPEQIREISDQYMEVAEKYGFTFAR